jgi:rare lipoprotein A
MTAQRPRPSGGVARTAGGMARTPGGVARTPGGVARTAGPIALAAVILALSACATPPSGRGAESPGSAARPGARDVQGRDAPASAGTAAARRGGYYLDDGPGERPGPDPESIADATPRAEPLLARANRPYVVFERQYVPMTRLDPWRERGIASWYGRRYHGQRTASGEVYDMYAMSAAHPTLPIPSYVRVTRVSSGRSVVVRVNDRGPFLNGRVIDLSWTAAAKLGYVQAGSGEVDVELITDPLDFAAPAPGASDRGAARAAVAPLEPVAPVVGKPVAERLDLETVIMPVAIVAPAGVMTGAAVGAMTGTAAGTAAGTATGVTTGAASTAVAPAGAPLFLQIGAFGQSDNAQAARLRAALALGVPPERLQVQSAGALFRVLAGPYSQRDAALADAERVRVATGLRPVPVASER